MKLYIVRHGESTWNDLKLHQHGEVPLSEKGKQQAAFVAKRFLDIPIDLIITSTMPRAQETATIIGEIINKQVITTNHLIELKRPTLIEGRSFDEPEVVAIKEDIKKNYDNPNWHHSDEENFYDLKARTKKTLAFLGARTEENIIIVSHGVIIRMLLALMCLGETLTPQIFRTFEGYLRMTNTGVSVCEKIDDKWHVLTINDYAHLP